MRSCAAGAGGAISCAGGGGMMTFVGGVKSCTCGG